MDVPSPPALSACLSSLEARGSSSSFILSRSASTRTYARICPPLPSVWGKAMHLRRTASTSWVRTSSPPTLDRVLDTGPGIGKPWLPRRQQNAVTSLQLRGAENRGWTMKHRPACRVPDACDGCAISCDFIPALALLCPGESIRQMTKVLTVSRLRRDALRLFPMPLSACSRVRGHPRGRRL